MSNNYSCLILTVSIMKLVIHHIMQSMLFFSVLAMICMQCVKHPIHSQLNWAILLCDVIPDGKTVVNCAVLRDDSASFRTVLCSCLSHRELRISPLYLMASSQGTSVSSNSFRRWVSHDIFLYNTTSCSTFYAFSSFRITLWLMWLANSKRQPHFHPPWSHAQEDTELTKKTDTPVGKPMLCQRTFSSVFRAVFLHS